MRLAMIGLLIFLFAAIIFGTIKPPTLDELKMVILSLLLLVIAFFYKRGSKTRDLEDRKNSSV